MATVGEEETEYESDPEDAKLSLAMRRREASDDEEEGGRREEGPRRIDSRAGIVSDGESDGQGGAAEYDDEELEVEDDEEEEVEYEEEGGVEEEEEEVDLVGEDEAGYEERGGEGVRESSGGGAGAIEAAVVKEVDGERRGSVGEAEAEDGQDGNQEEEEEEKEEEKKDNEPFAVPTAGAFYMHDDRFRDNAGGRHRRTLGGRKLWESKDDRKWGHDKFEEMTLQERHYEEGRRNSKGNYRGRGKNRGMDRGYVRGNRSKAYNNNNQNQAPKGVRGRGPRRYEPPTKSKSETLPTQAKQSGKSLEKSSHTSSGRVFTPTSNMASNPVSARKNVFGSSLSSASPPFYPSGSSNKDSALTQKRDVQVGSSNKNVRTSVIDESFSIPQSNALLRGKNIVDSVGMDKLYIDDSISPAGKPSTNLQLPPTGSSFINTVQIPQSRAQGRGLAFSGQMSFQTTPPHNQVNRVSSPTTQLHAVQRSPPVQSRVQPSLQPSAQSTGQRPGNGSQASSPPKAALSIKSFESGEMESPSESSKSKTALVGKGKGSVQGSGRGSFLYNGAQAMGASGNMGGGHGDQNFPATFLPVMQFGGQHPGGIGVPAVGMAFPGYVAQPQLGLGNSEMTWLPVLAGAAGALGATYCSPYFSVDGAYHARPSGQTSSTGSASKENNTNKPNNEWKPSQRPELVGDEFGQRQNKPRRYSEMNFGQ